MLLVSLVTYRERLNFDDIPDINEVLTGVLHNATDILASLLRCEFDKKARTMRYRGDGVLLPNEVSGTRLFIPGGFVRATPAFTVRQAESIGDLKAGASVDIASYANIEAEMGVLTISDYDIGTSYIEMTCSTGFDLEPENADLYTQSEVPGWLKELAMLTATVGVDAHPVAGFPETPAEATINLKQRQDIIVEKRTRYLPLAVRPFYWV